MDLEDEKAKALIRHNLEIIRLIIDKVIIGVIVLIIGFFVNISIENYRAKLTEQRFYLEKKFEALTKINEAYNKVTLELFNATDRNKGNTEVPSVTLAGALDEFNKVFGHWSIVLSDDFAEQTIAHYWTYLGINNKNSLPHWNEFREFTASYLMHSYGELLAHELNPEATVKSDGFELTKWTFKEADEREVHSYAITQLNNWKKWKSRQGL